MTSVDSLIGRIEEVILQPIVVLLFAVALLYFLWGGAQFMFSVNSDQGREEGKQHMLWGVIGMFIMVSVYGIIRILEDTIHGLGF